MKRERVGGGGGGGRMREHDSLKTYVSEQDTDRTINQTVPSHITYT